ncbi:MAG: hypothetical protein II901_03080 [Paludibacteraceae bacterium]|nr:hypothetical protein [Paludibacteraceae bacterium]
MNKIQQTISSYKSLFILGGILVAGIWFCVLGQSMFETSKKTKPANPGIVALQSKTSSAEMPMTSKSSRAIIPMHAEHNVFVAYISAYSDMPKAKMSSTSMRLHETSGANVHSISSGSGNGGGIAMTSGNNNARGIQNLTYSGVIYMPIAFNAVTEVGASNANELASTVTRASGPARAKKTDDDPFDPFLDPIGDVAWPLMILLAAAYATMRGVRKVRQEER